MTFNQTSLPKDLRPVNVVRTVTEDPRITVATTTGRHLEGALSSTAHEAGSPGSVPVFYPATVSDAGFVVSGRGNQFPGVTAWCSRPPAQLGHVGVNAISGLGYSPNSCNRVVAHATGQFSNDMVGGFGFSQGLYNRDSAYRNGRPNTEVLTVNCCNPSLGNQSGGSAAEVRGEEGGDDSVSRKKVKLMCSFGGKILPRPSDGMLRYVGGQTRVISVRRDVSFPELMQKLVDTYGQPVVIKYQLPGEDLDALVSISCPDDLDNMMEEYEKLIERSSDGSAKLRVFLFSASEFDLSDIMQFNALQDGGQRYVEAVNGVADVFGGGITRKESIASASSTQNSDFSGTEVFERYVLSPREDLVVSNDNAPRTFLPMAASSATFTASAGSSAVKLDPSQTEVMMSEKPSPHTIQQQQLGHEPCKTRILPSTHHRPGYVDCHNESSRQPDFVHPTPQAGFPNSHLLGVAGPPFTQQPFNGNAMNLPSTQQFFSPVHMTMTPSSHDVGVRPVVIQPIVPSQETHSDYPDESTNLGVRRVVQYPVDHSNAAYCGQIPSGVLSGGYGWHRVAPSDNIVFSDGVPPHQHVIAPEILQSLEDCHMCQKALPHAHSDPIAHERNDTNGNSAPIITSVYHSGHPDDSMGRQLNKFMGQPRVTSNMAHQVKVPQPEVAKLTHDTETQNEHERTALHSDGVGAAQVQASEPPVHGTLEEQSNEILGGFQKAINANPRHIGGFIENLPICSSETYPSNEIYMPPTDKKQEKEKLANRPEQSGGTDIFSDTTFGQIPYFDGKNYVKQTEIPSNTWVEVPSVRDSRSTHSSGLLHSPFLANARLHPQHAIGVQQVDPVESCHVASREPTVDCKNDRSGLQEKVFGTDSQMYPLNANLPSLTSSDGVGDVQDSSNTFVSDQDTWNFKHDDINPPSPIEVQTRKEALKGHDPFGNRYAMVEIQNLEEPLHQEMLQNLSNLNKDFSSKGLEEEHIKQELQNVAEGVAASVLDSPATSYSGLAAEMDESASDTNQEREVSRGNVDNQHTTYLEDMGTKLPDRLNFGSPVSERLGRLQIIKDSDLEELRELGSGMFGTVYHGKWRGTDIAIKRINDRCFAGKPSEQERMIDDFWNEAIKLADLHHPNVVAFYGVVLDSPGGSVATVTEYMVNGSLRNALQMSIRNIDKRKRLLIAMDVAFGMEYLHGKNIVHFDLKSDNLLVNLRDPHRPICKVGDLGLSKVKCQTLISGGVRGTLPWMAPELLNGSSSLVSEKVDVFSFGIVMWELLTGEEPYAELHYGVIIGGIVSNSLRPSVPESCEQDWKSLMERCWSAEPSERPNFTEIANELRSMAAKLPTKGQVSSQLQP